MSEPTIEQRYDALLRLKPNWDSYGAPRINKRCVSMAKEIHYELLHLGEWRIVPGCDGGVQLELHEGGLDIEIDVSPAFSKDGSAE